MARKYAKKSKRTQSRKPKGRRKAKPMTKTMVKAVKKIVATQIDRAVEDKYLLDQYFTNHAANVDLMDNSLMVDLSPTIVEGAGPSQRIGKKVNFKNLRVQLRFLPRLYCKNISAGLSEGFTLISNQSCIPQQPPIEVFLCEINKELWQNTTAEAMRGALAIKFRDPGIYRQDLYGSTAQKGVTGIKLLCKTKLKHKYKSQATFMTDGSPSGDKLMVTSLPMFDYAVLATKYKKSVLYDANVPSKFKIILYARFDSKWRDSSLEVIPKPQELSTRVLYNYEDA